MQFIIYGLRVLGCGTDVVWEFLTDVRRGELFLPCELFVGSLGVGTLRSFFVFLDFGSLVRVALGLTEQPFLDVFVLLRRFNGDLNPCPSPSISLSLSCLLLLVLVTFPSSSSEEYPSVESSSSSSSSSSSLVSWSDSSSFSLWLFLTMVLPNKFCTMVVFCAAVRWSNASLPLVSVELFVCGWREPL